MNDSLATRRDMQEFFKVSYRTIVNWEQEHGLPARKIGGKIRFAWDEVYLWLDAQEEKTMIEDYFRRDK